MMEGNPESRYLLANEESTRDRQRHVGEVLEQFHSRDAAKSFWRDTSRKQKITFVYAAACYLAIFFCQGIPEPFLSRVVVSRGGKKIYAAAIMLSTHLSGSVASMLCGKYQSRIPTKTFVWTGQLILGITQGCLGFLNFCDNLYVFVSLGIFVKMMQGIGQGFSKVSVLTLLWHEIPDHVEKCFGITKVMLGLGFLIGPPSGGYMFSIHNEILIPFTVSAILPLMVSLIGWLILPNIGKAEETHNFKVWSYIFSPTSIVPLGLASSTGAVFAVFAVTFTTYAQTMGVSVVTVGIMFSVTSTFTIFGNILCGYLGELNHICRKFLLAFSFIGVFAINFSFTDNQTTALLYVELSIFAMLSAFVQVFAFSEMIYQCVGENESVGNNLSFRSKLSGVWYFAFTLFRFVFGVVGSGMQSVLSYSMSLTFSMVVGLTVTFVSSGSMCLYRRKFKQ